MGRRRPKPLDRRIEQLAASIKQPENDLEDSINKGQKNNAKHWDIHIRTFHL